jgi:hypothetical protein
MNENKKAERFEKLEFGRYRSQLSTTNAYGRVYLGLSTSGKYRTTASVMFWGLELRLFEQRMGGH